MRNAQTLNRLLCVTYTVWAVDAHQISISERYERSPLTEL